MGGYVEKRVRDRYVYGRIHAICDGHFRTRSSKQCGCILCGNIKASAPLFTVFVARIMLREVTEIYIYIYIYIYVVCVCVCVSAELSFNFIGFFAACMCNCIDCIQNVFSKKLLSGRYLPLLSFTYTSAAALLVQFPLFLYHTHTHTPNEEQGEFNSTLMYCLLIDGVSYHLQSVFAYKVMSYISTSSSDHVQINTAKRAVLICLPLHTFTIRSLLLPNKHCDLYHGCTQTCTTMSQQGGTFHTIYSFCWWKCRQLVPSVNRQQTMTTTVVVTTTSV